MILIDNLLQIVETETGVKITRDKRKKNGEKNETRNGNIFVCN